MISTGIYDKDIPYEPTQRPYLQPYPPRPRPRPEPQPSQDRYIAHKGDNTSINCQIQNYDGKLTSWRRLDGRPLPRSSYLSGGNLIIEYTENDAAGVYECFVREAYGDVPLVTAELEVVELPKISLYPPMPLTVRTGEHVYIYCNATGEQPIYINWHLENHRPLPPYVLFCFEFI